MYWIQLCVCQIWVGSFISFQSLTRFLLVLFQKSKKSKSAGAASQQETSAGNTAPNFVSPSESWSWFRISFFLAFFILLDSPGPSKAKNGKDCVNSSSGENRQIIFTKSSGWWLILVWKLGPELFVYVILILL